VLLRIEADNERRDVDDLLANADVPLPDEDTSVVDRLGQATLENLGLEPPLQEILDLQGKHVIEPHAGLVEHTNADKPTNEGVALEETLGVFVVEFEELTSCTTNFGEDKRDAPDFALVAETVLASKLELSIETGGAVRPPGDLVCLAVIPWCPWHCC